MSRPTAAPVPTGRVSRLFKLGRLASGIAIGALGESTRQLARGDRPDSKSALLIPANAERIATELAQMRGAVMKVGQLLSMEAGDLLPRELADVLARLRDDAYAMPRDQLHGVLVGAWGEDWRDRFAEFDEEPFAAASIGQVHAATDRQGRRLAIKVQYPGVADSIDSDVANVAALLRLFRLVPPGLELDPLLDIARAQLRDETDYALEASHLRRYRDCLGDDAVFEVPDVIDALSGPTILAMTFIDGASVERLVAESPQARDHFAARLIDLCLREFLDWGLVQSDPNFANFRYDGARGRIGLLDFGAARVNTAERGASFSRLLEAALADDWEALTRAACEVGYVEAGDDFNARMAIIDLVQTAATPAREPGCYDFAASNLPQVLSDKLLYLRNQPVMQRVPPADVLFLHRKLAGIFLLCARIGARVDVGDIVRGHISRVNDINLRATG